MLRIERAEADGISTLRLQGKLVAPWLPEFKTLFQDGIPLQQMRLNLREVDYIDAAGVELLATLQRQGLLIVEPSLFIATLLDQSHP